MHTNDSGSPSDSYLTLRQELNATRYKEGDTKGHYESYFLRANHPTKPLAFWFRYSIFSPKTKKYNKHKVIGELWAVVFNREKNTMTAVKEEYLINDCAFSADGLDINIAELGRLLPNTASGTVNKNGHTITWDIKYEKAAAPIKLLPNVLYKSRLPSAKTTVPNPMLIFNGVVTVNNETYVIDNWVGSQNHNWGSRHIDEYAWGQVAGFDNEPDAFLECATARVKLGPFQTHWFTTAVLHYDDKKIDLNNLWWGFKAKATFKSFNWHFDTKNKAARIQCTIEAPLESFVGFNYYKPEGGSSVCLNSKIAKCHLLLSQEGKPDRVFKTKHRAAFEIFNTERDHGVLVIA